MTQLRLSGGTVPSCGLAGCDAPLLTDPGSLYIKTSEAPADDIALRSQRCQRGPDHRQRGVIKTGLKIFVSRSSSSFRPE